MSLIHPSRGITRRGILQGAAAVTAAGLILPAGMRPAMAQPKPGGTFRLGIGHGSTTDGLDPVCGTSFTFRSSGPRSTTT